MLKLNPQSNNAKRCAHVEVNNHESSAFVNGFVPLQEHLRLKFSGSFVPPFHVKTHCCYLS